MFSPLFTFFLLILVAGTSSIRGQQQSEQQQQTCRRPTTGDFTFPSILLEFFRGVDLTTLNWSFSKGIKETTLFNLTCDRGTSWSDGSVAYLMPDQIASVSTLTSNVRQSTPVTCYQLGCYRQKMLTASLQLDSELKPVNGRGVMAADEDVKSELLGNHYAYGEIHSDRLKFSVTMAPAEDLRPSCILSERLRSLQGDYASNPAPYEEAISQFGTHYFAGGTFGARHIEFSRFKPAYFFTSLAASPGNLSDSIRAHFEGHFDRLEPTYQQNVLVGKFSFGRFSPTPDEPGSYWPLAVSLKPLSELLEQGHPAKGGLAVAIRVHLTRAALQDWLATLQSVTFQRQLYPVGWGLLLGAFEPARLSERISEQLQGVAVPEWAAVGRIGMLVETMEDFVGLMHDHTLKEST